MSHVVMQAASFTTLAAARRAEAELRRLTRAYIAFEAEDPDPWRDDRVAPPLVDFGRTHGIDWPHRQDARFLLKGSFADSAEVLLVDRLVFFWGGGFELGGSTLRAVLVRLGDARRAVVAGSLGPRPDPVRRLAIGPGGERVPRRAVRAARDCVMRPRKSCTHETLVSIRANLRASLGASP